MGRWGSLWRPGQSVASVDVAGAASAYMHSAGAYGSGIPDPLPDDEPAPVPEHRDNRSRRYPSKPGGDRGRPPYITPPRPDIPDVPNGTELHLMPGEWSHLPGMPPSATVVMTVVALHPDWGCATDAEVWVSGHRPQCAYSGDRHLPCMRLIVRLDVLRRAVGKP